MRIFAILFLINLTACLSLSVPNQTKSPTTVGHKVLSISAIGSFLGPWIKFLPPDRESSSGSLAPPMPTGLRLGYGITDKIDIESELLIASVPYLSAGLGVKYQWLGESAFKTEQNDWTSTAQLNFIHGYGEYEEYEEYEGERPFSFVRNLLSGSGVLYGFSLSNSFGYMVLDWLVVYGGAKVTYLSAEYNVDIEAKEQKDPQVESKTAESTTSSNKKIGDKFWIYGPFAGIQLKKTMGPHWKIIFTVEGNTINLPQHTGWYKKRKRIWQPHLAASLNILLPF